MMDNVSKKRLYIIISILVGIFTMLIGGAVNSINYHLTGLLLLIVALLLYIFVVLCIADHNWLDIRAVFAGVWLGTIGLAAFRFAGYQKQWDFETWGVVVLAYTTFEIGANWGIAKGRKWHLAFKEMVKNLRIGHLRLELQGNRLFAICVIVSLLGLICFSVNAAVKGFIPCFSKDVNAYQNFYTRIHVFSTAATTVSGLCYYCIRTQKLKNWQRFVLFLCIFYLVFAFPIMVVSRGVFVVAALSLTVAVFYLHRKKLSTLILCLIVILGVYFFASLLRDYTDDQLTTFFNSTQTTIDPIETDLPDDEATVTEPLVKDSESKLPPKLLFLYGYLTVSHDNLNEAVLHTQKYTWGTRQLKPFNVILRNQWIENRNATAEYYQVNIYLNTVNLVGDFYYDFGIIGVAVLTLLWSFVFGIIQSIYECGKCPFALLALGNTMSAVALSFFASWMSTFNFWLFWGVAFLLAFAACITRKTGKNDV